MPAKGPIRPHLMPLMVLVSKSGFSAFSFSMETARPMIKGASAWVVLKNMDSRFRASMYLS